jgi:hypothetical protein
VAAQAREGSGGVKEDSDFSVQFSAKENVASQPTSEHWP